MPAALSNVYVSIFVLFSISITTALIEVVPISIPNINVSDGIKELYVVSLNCTSKSYCPFF